MGSTWPSKNPADYQYVPPPERTETTGAVLAGVAVIALCIPGILVLVRHWDNGVPVLNAISIAVLALIGHRLWRGNFSIVSRWRTD